MQFGIVGSGIIGLTTAAELLQQYPDSKITIISNKSGLETTSHGAAGIFRPGGGFRVEGEKEGLLSRTWIKSSYDHYERIMNSDNDPKRHGIKKTSGYMFSDGLDTTKNDLLQGIVPVYRNVTEDELKICPGQWKYGSFFTTMVIDAGLHINWLAEGLSSRVRFLKRELRNLTELNEYDYIFNCSGLGAKWLCNDASVVPIRGQVFKVHAPWIKMFYYSNTDTYIIPGMNHVTLGGTRQFDNYNTSIDPYDSAGIWERCVKLVPNLAKSTVVKEWAGLRPYRDGGVRAEAEHLLLGFKKGLIVHNYGHGGYGITFAPGSCKHSVHLFNINHRASGNQILSRL